MPVARSPGRRSSLGQTIEVHPIAARLEMAAVTKRGISYDNDTDISPALLSVQDGKLAGVAVYIFAPEKPRPAESDPNEWRRLSLVWTVDPDTIPQVDEKTGDFKQGDGTSALLIEDLGGDSRWDDSLGNGLFFLMLNQDESNVTLRLAIEANHQSVYLKIVDYAATQVLEDGHVVEHQVLHRQLSELRYDVAVYGPGGELIPSVHL